MFHIEAIMFLFTVQFLIIHCIVVLAQSSIYISQNEHSKDNVGCGNLWEPCRTLDYAIQRSKPSDKIFLDREYEFDQSDGIKIQHDLELSSYCFGNCSKNQSNVAVWSKSSDNAIFNLTSASVVLTHLRFISYYYPDTVPSCVFWITNGVGQLHIEGCHFRFVTFGFAVDLFAATSSGYFQTLDIKNSTFDTMEPVELATKSTKQSKKGINEHQTSNFQTKISITDSNFNNFQLKISIDFTLDAVFQGNKFVSSVLHVFQDNNWGGSLNLTNNYFYKSPITIKSLKPGDFKITMDNLVTESSLIALPYYMKIYKYQVNIDFHDKVDLWTIHIKNSHFIGSTMGALSIKSAAVTRWITVVIEDTVFRDVLSNDNTNAVPTMQMISSAARRNVFKLVNCLFLNNLTPINIASAFYIRVDNSDHAYDLPDIKLDNVSIISHGSQSRETDTIFQIQGMSMDLFDLNNFTVKCQKGNQKIQLQSIHGLQSNLNCIRCNGSAYNVLDAALKYNISSIRYKTFNSTCRSCPYQASCIGDIKSRGNFWGYLNPSSGEISFILCPPYYCCSNLNQCISYNTCANNRMGRLCGECLANHSLSIFSQNKCIPTKDCDSKGFWIGYSFAIFFSFFLVLYYKDVFVYVVKLVKKYHQHRKVNPHDTSFDDYSPGERSNSPYELLLEDTEPNQAINENNKSNSMFSGTIKIAFFFYQTASIIRIQASAKENYQMPVIIELMTSLFDIRISVTSKNFVNVCPLETTNVFLIELLRVSIVFWCLIFALLLMATIFSYRKIVSKLSKKCHVNLGGRSLMGRLKIGYLQLMLLGYSSIATTLIKAVHCEKIGESYYTYQQATEGECYQVWQVVVWSIICVWVIPFPIVLYIGCKMLSGRWMTTNEFITAITLPPSITWILIKSYCRKRQRTGDSNDLIRDEQVDDTKSLLLVMNEPFRLNHDSNEHLIWEPILILRRLMLLSVSTYLATFPILKLYPIGIILMLFTYHDYVTSPYDDKRLNNAQLVSFLLLILLTFVNTFWAFPNNLDLKYHITGQVFLYLEIFILIFPFVIGFLKLLSYIFKGIYKYFLRKQD